MHWFSDHDLKSREDFDMNNDVALLDFCSHKTLDVKERNFIHLLNSLKPSGLNSNDPLSTRYFKESCLDHLN